MRGLREVVRVYPGLRLRVVRVFGRPYFLRELVYGPHRRPGELRGLREVVRPGDELLQRGLLDSEYRESLRVVLLVYLGADVYFELLRLTGRLLYLRVVLRESSERLAELWSLRALLLGDVYERVLLRPLRA